MNTHHGDKLEIRFQDAASRGKTNDTRSHLTHLWQQRKTTSPKTVGHCEQSAGPST